MKTLKLSTVLAGALLVVGVSSSACVADRPSRNGVFNENQYLRKDFLVIGTDANGASPGQDPGWMMRATITETSTPNLLGGAIGIISGEELGVKLVRFRVTSDTLQMLDQIQYSNPVSPDPKTGAPTGPSNETGTTETIMNAWPATNVDLKYRVNLDGEKTNFYEENQELDWQVRQWVKLTFDKNDFSDLAPIDLTSLDLINKCGDITEASAALVTDSFNVEGSGDSDPSNDYFEFTVQVAVPLTFLGSTPTDTTCLTAYGPLGVEALRLGKTSVTVNLKYSFKRATPIAQVTYKPFTLAEKDPIRTKYGPIMDTIVWNRDNQTSLVAATQYVNRFDPTKPIVWYFDKGFPEYYKHVFVGDNAGNPGIMQATNKVLTAAGVAARVTFLNYNDDKAYQDGLGTPRNYGDIRYNFMRYVSDQDSETQWGAVTMPGPDPRTGEVINNGIEFNSEALRDVLVQRLDAFLQTVGASQGLDSGKWPSGSCTTGATQPIVTATVVANHNTNSTLYSKMQQYLGLHGPDPKNDHLGPQDFIAVQDDDFYRAYFALAPYELFADPDLNQFVTREGGAGVYGPAGAKSLWNLLEQETAFQRMASTIDSGAEPYTPGSPIEAANFANAMRTATEGHKTLERVKSIAFHGLHMDSLNPYSFEAVAQQASQRCVNGSWESQDAWIQRTIDTYYIENHFWHEFGHGMGLDHNFMASVDQPNFTPLLDANGKQLSDPFGNPMYNMYSSSVMEYNTTPSDVVFSHQDWGTYDKGAMAFIYANDAKQADDPTKDMKALANKSRSGIVPGTNGGADSYPFKDPLGFCQSGEVGCTAGAERQFLRCDATHLTYSPLCRQEDLGVTPSQIIANSIDTYEWQYQWRNFRDYRKVWDESSYASAVSGFIIDNNRFLSQWIFDWNPGNLATVLYRIGITPPPTAISAVDYYNQLTNKFLKEMSLAGQMTSAFSEAIIQQAAGERPFATVYDKFYGDVTQQGIILDKYFAMQNFVGLWISNNYDQNQSGAYISSWGSFGFDSSYNSVAETAISSMIGAQYSVYPYFIPTAVALFAQDTHNPAYLNSLTNRVEAKDWIGGWTFVREQDLIDFFKPLAVTAGVCAKFEGCTYDVTDPTQVAQNPITHQFTGPDGLSYMYAYIPSRENWVLARQDRNIVTWKLINQYNTDIYGTLDDGTQEAYPYEYQIKYTIDAYNAFEYGGGIDGTPPPPAAAAGM